jgi:outer membrane receptor protein involved in Fe transport
MAGAGLRVLFAAIVVATAAPAGADTLPIEVPILVIEEETTDVESMDVDLSQLVLSASKRVESVQETASIVTVITRDQIVQRGYRTLSDVLADVPGFDGYRPSFYFGSIEAFARGNARTILVLWNGVPLNSPQDNRASHVAYPPLEAVERIEVLSGPGGVIWGANAFLGIVNLITSDGGSTPAVEVRTGIGGGAGDDALYRASASLSGSWWGGRVRFFGHVAYVSSRGPIFDPPYDLLFGPFPPPDTDGAYRLNDGSGETHGSRSTFVPIVLALSAGPLRFDLYWPIVNEQLRDFNDLGVRTDRFVTMDGDVIAGSPSQRAESVALASLRWEQAVGVGARFSLRGYYTGFEDYRGTLLACVEKQPNVVAEAHATTESKSDSATSSTAEERREVRDRGGGAKPRSSGKPKPIPTNVGPGCTTPATVTQ